MPAMPPIPRRVITPPSNRQIEPAAEPEVEQEDDSVDESYLAFGDAAKTRVKDSQAASSPRGYREFFITKAESAAAQQKGEQGVTVRVHFIRNYAKVEENVSVPRCNIVENGKYRSYTSAGDDCALAAGGARVSIRPVYLLIDHRSYKRKDNTTAAEELKLWIPMPSVLGVMENAIKNLAENLGKPVDQIDITKHEAKITKIGSGRNTTWSIDFVIQPKALGTLANENIKKALEEGYRKTLSKWLAPNPRYLISKGGRYVQPVKATPADDEGGEVPY